MNNLRTQSQYIKDTTREISDVLRRYVFTGEKRIKIFMKRIIWKNKRISFKQIRKNWSYKERVK